MDYKKVLEHKFKKLEKNIEKTLRFQPKRPENQLNISLKPAFHFLKNFRFVVVVLS